MTIDPYRHNNLTTSSGTVTPSGTEYSALADSETLLVPLPPTPFFKIQDKFLFDHLVQDPDEAPTDRYNLYFLAFMVLGAGFHLPFNSFVAAVDYFMITYNRDDMAFVVASTNSYTVCLSVVANVLLVNRVSTHTRISFGYLAFMISLVTMAGLVVLTLLDRVDREVGFQVTVAATVFTGRFRII